MARFRINMLVSPILLVTPLAVAAQSTTGEANRFVASARGRVYYYIGCSAWKQLRPADRIYFKSAADAERAGYTPSRSPGCAPHVQSKAASSGLASRTTICRVARVHDGDTFACASGERVRLLLVDAPELGQGPFGRAARDAAARLLPVGTPVRLEFDVQRHDRYRRLLAYAYVDSLMVNRQLARQGMALVSVYPPNVKYVELMRAAVDSARQQKVGLWSGSAFECPPADYRARRCR